MDLERSALESYLLVFAAALLVAGLLPFEFYGPDPVWPWEGLLDAGLRDGLSLLLPLLGAASFFLVARWRPAKVTQAAFVLLALALGWALAALGASGAHPQPVYGHLTDGLPALFGRAFWLLLLGVVLLGAGMRLGARGIQDSGGAALVDPLPLARVLLALGSSATVAFYLLPYRGALPLVGLVAGLGDLIEMAEFATALPLLAGHALSLGPLFFAGFGLWRMWRPAAERGGMAVALLAAYLPVLVLLVGLRNIPLLPALALIHLRSAILLASVTAGGILALAALVRASWYEIPAVFGTLNRTDAVLAAALADADPRSALGRRLAELDPLLRPFARRRLAIWQRAATEVPGANEADLGAVIGMLERRLREERDIGSPLIDAPAVTGPVGWCGWMRRGRVAGALGLLALVAAGLSWWATRAPDPGESWSLRPADEAVTRLFSEEIPEAVSGLSRWRGRLQDMGEWIDLQRSLTELEPRLPGLRQRVEVLLELGRRGRARLLSIRRAQDRLNRLLQAAGVPFYVRSRVRAGSDRDLFYALTYRVEDCRLYRLRADPRRRYAVLFLSRADGLNVIENYMGMTEDEETVATVFVDRLGSFLEGRLAPLAGREDELGQQIREAIVSLTGNLESLDGEVEGPLGRILLEGLARHELNHRHVGLEPEPPAVLWAELAGFTEESVRGVAAEAGAYLSELAYRPAYARLRLAMMLDELGEEAGTQGSHGRARAFLVRALLGVRTDAWGWRLGGATEAVERLGGLDDGELTRRVEALHRSLFGAPVTVFDRIDNPGDGWDAPAAAAGGSAGSGGGER